MGAELQAPLVDGTAVRYVNLDYAASTPALQQVNDYVQSVLPYYASVHRGAGYASQISTSLYENARRTVRNFVGGREDDAVIFTRNTTDSLNLLAGCLPEDGEVLYLDVEHHANLLPWLQLPHRGLVAAYLSAEHGVGLRDGKFCAHPLLKRLGLPSGSLRASFGLGSRQDDVDRLLTGLRSLLRDGLGTDYAVDAGRWVPAVETRPFPDWAPPTPGTAGAAPCTTD